MEKENLKKADAFFINNELKFNFIENNEGTLPVKKQCDVMNVSRRGYYARFNRPAKIVSESEVMLYRRIEALI